jgi:hypothetical protein
MPTKLISRSGTYCGAGETGPQLKLDDEKSRVERHARAQCVELARVTDDRPLQWRMLDSLAQGLKFATIINET